jgi:putative transposase
MHDHLLFVSKYRDRVLDDSAIPTLPEIFNKVGTDFESTWVEMDGEDHHVHLLVQYPPKVSVSSLVNSLKGVSSRMLRQERPDLRKRYWKGVMVAVLLCSILWWSAYRHPQAIHRTTTDSN